MKLKLSQLVVLSIAVAGSALHADSLMLTPPDIQGAPGQTVGWGFTFLSTNDYAILTGSSFDPAVSFGTYTDYLSGANYVVTTPGLAMNQPFNPFNPYGVGAFSIDSVATPGFSVSGSITVYYDLYSVSPNDPSFDPIADLVSSNHQLTTNATLLVVDTPVSLPTGPIPVPPGPTAAPEPELFYVTALSLVGIVLLRRVSASRRR
jgi:hypothetical protein